MAFVLNRTLFIILFIFIIINSIDGYILHEQIDTSDFNNDLTSNNEINVRSVLWPRICFSTLSKKTTRQYPDDQFQQHESNKRNMRKCYPFDTV